jgi:heme-degrading monooxygenase HmoA
MVRVGLLLGRREFVQRVDGNMIGEVIVIGNLKRRDDAPVDEYDRLGERMYNIVSRLPGFLSVKSFKAADGEELTVFRFASEEALEAWRTHPEHVETMKRGHAEFYASGFLQICRVIREVGPFEHS